MTPNLPRRKITWNEIVNTIRELGNRLEDGSKIWGIPRNGLIIVGIMAHQNPSLKLQVCETPRPGAIIVDDIYDTGKTLERYTSLGFTTASLYWRENCDNRKPNIFVDIVEDDSWLDFPWEIR